MCLIFRRLSHQDFLLIFPLNPAQSLALHSGLCIVILEPTARGFQVSFWNMPPQHSVNTLPEHLLFKLLRALSDPTPILYSDLSTALLPSIQDQAPHLPHLSDDLAFDFPELWMHSHITSQGTDSEPGYIMHEGSLIETSLSNPLTTFNTSPLTLPHQTSWNCLVQIRAHLWILKLPPCNTHLKPLSGFHEIQWHNSLSHHHHLNSPTLIPSSAPCQLSHPLLIQLQNFKCFFVSLCRTRIVHRPLQKCLWRTSPWLPSSMMSLPTLKATFVSSNISLIDVASQMTMTERFKPFSILMLLSVMSGMELKHMRTMQHYGMISRMRSSSSTLDLDTSVESISQIS